MRRWFFSALFSAALFVLVLPLAAGAQEGTAETTQQANDAAKAGVEAATSNVSAETGNGSSSNNTGSQQSSDITVSQSQTGEGSQSQAVTGDLNISQNSNSSCKNPNQLDSINNSDTDDSFSFTTTGDKFRVSYDVTFDNRDNSSNDFRIVIRDSSDAEVGPDIHKTDDANADVIVNDGPDTYELHATVQPNHGATYSVTVDDCRGNNNDGGGNNGSNNRHHHNRHHHNRFHHNRFHHNRHNNNDNAVHKQYTSEKTVEDTVIKETIPNKGQLANTGGMPLAGVAFLSLAIVGLGVSVLRSAIRRER